MIPTGHWSAEWEVLIRIGCFLGVFLFLALVEILIPRRKSAPVKGKRWWGNLSVILVNTVCVRLVFPLMAIDVALLATQNGWGLFQHYPTNYYASVFLGVIILDLGIYLQHVMFHAIPLLWRFHRMHHADIDFDVTTGTRFHPVEILLSMVIKIGVVVAVGIPPLAVLIFEILLNATSMFTHSNIRLPLGFDRIIRFLIVTPDMHRVHHSIEVNETNSNYGFNLSIWDRVFGTYKDQPAAGHEKMTIGVTLFREPKFMKLRWMLAIPFLKKMAGYPINRRSLPKDSHKE